MPLQSPIFSFQDVHECPYKRGNFAASKNEPNFCLEIAGVWIDKISYRAENQKILEVQVVIVPIDNVFDRRLVDDNSPSTNTVSVPNVESYEKKKKHANVTKHLAAATLFESATPTMTNMHIEESIK
jgi:hypothetical protein